ncbi:MAG: SDR family oxidoreductase [Oscillospiraceae bacterium]|jgi:3-oxoacyl-[acyl-carrier protein] reductase|nr:SDR family oxidoreductase [Oscillospiraceae bacterium]
MGILEGKVALVTGSGQGIGRAIALLFAEQGAKVVTNNRKPGGSAPSMVSPEQLAKLSAEERATFDKGYESTSGDAESTAALIKSKGGEATPCYADITKLEDAKKLIDFTVATYGRIDILCNVAGGFGFSPIEDITDELWDRVNGVKPRGYWHTLKYAVPVMKAQKSGRIILCASPAFMGDTLTHAEYCAANAGVIGLTRAAAIELRPHGITVNCFAPAAATRASYELEAAKKTHDKGIIAEGRTYMEMGELPGPEHVAPFVTYLASPNSEKVSGAVFMVMGNMINRFQDPTSAKMLFKQAAEPWTIDELLDKEGELFEGYKSLAD